MEDILTKTRIHSDQESNKNLNMIKEGNKLWIKLVEEPSLERRKQLEGSEYDYYITMFKFLKTTPYEEALKYVVEKINCFRERRKFVIHRKRRLTINWIRAKIKRMLYLLKYQGIILTIKKAVYKYGTRILMRIKRIGNQK